MPALPFVVARYVEPVCGVNEVVLAVTKVVSPVTFNVDVAALARQRKKTKQECYSPITSSFIAGTRRPDAGVAEYIIIPSATNRQS